MPPSSSESEPWWHWPWSLAECSASPADQHTKKNTNTKLMTCTHIDAHKNSKHARIHASGHLGATHGNFKPTTWKNTTQKLINLQRCTFMALGVCNWQGTISWKGHVKKTVNLARDTSFIPHCVQANFWHQSLSCRTHKHPSPLCAMRTWCLCLNGMLGVSTFHPSSRSFAHEFLLWRRS